MQNKLADLENLQLICNRCHAIPVTGFGKRRHCVPVLSLQCGLPCPSLISQAIRCMTWGRSSIVRVQGVQKNGRGTTTLMATPTATMHHTPQVTLSKPTRSSVTIGKDWIRPTKQYLINTRTSKLKIQVSIKSIKERT